MNLLVVPENKPNSPYRPSGIKVDPKWLRPFSWDENVDMANKHIFGNEAFRENQREIINATKSGKNVLALIPTGGGKSLTF